uniref:Ribosome maturation protein SDO1/SBDS N-terminal domain-containing protein n=2 Tax=Lotharella globosa TaxID=91324 RepID=A0A6V3TBP9_9EUKA|mmetsp:Transcript_6630/g.13058  ORF Transcript_6630/g.13058 Transcript_6630/m.13058 type:complete len:289 (+) Transcript_6630:50-916(+)
MSRQKRNTTTSYHLVRLKFGKKTIFELMAHPGAAADFRIGKKSLQEALMVDTVFTNAKKAKVATSSELQTAFGTSDFQEVARRILMEGDAQTTSGERKASAEAIQRQITEFVIRNFVDARTGLRIPASRVQAAMVKFNCDMKEDIVQQARRFVRGAQAKGDLQLRRKEVVHTASFPMFLKGTVLALVEGLGCSILSRSKEKDMFVIELGCLAGELDEVVKKLDRITSQQDRDGETKSRGKARRGARKSQQNETEASPSGGKGRRNKGKAANTKEDGKRRSARRSKRTR